MEPRSLMADECALARREEQYYILSNLLPYEQDILLTSLGEKIRVLKLIIFFCHSGLDALHAFFAREYNKFDAQVSENLCQIRACQLLEIIRCFRRNKTNFFSFFESTFQEKIYRCQFALRQYVDASEKRPNHYTKHLHESICLKTFLSEHTVDFVLLDDMYFLIQVYLLSQYKLVGEYDISPGIDYDMLCRALNIFSKTFARKVVHAMQRNLSRLSCKFVFELSRDIDMSNDYQMLLKSLYLKDEVGRHVLPCYEVTKIILGYNKRRGEKIKIIVNRIAPREHDKIIFYLFFSRSQDCYLLSREGAGHEERGILTFVGIARYNECYLGSKTAYISRFLDVGFENIILSHMAQHPQFAGIQLVNKKYNPYKEIRIQNEKNLTKYFDQKERRFLYDKHRASILGCSPDNASLFLLTHVRCDSMGIGVFL